MCESSLEKSGSEFPGGHPRRADWVLLNAEWIVTCDSKMQSFSSGGMAITGDTISAVGPSHLIASQFTAQRTLDLKGCMIIPGLVNTHTHAAMSVFRGMKDDLPLQRWLFEVIFPAERRIADPDMVYWGTLLSCAEMLTGGITTFCDGYFFEEAAVRAAMDSGMRAVLGQGILDTAAPDQDGEEQSRDRAAAFIESFPGNIGRLRPSLFCLSPYTCSAGTLQWVKAFCRKHRVLYQVHVAETAIEVAESTALHGLRPVARLDELGVLDTGTLCVHAVWLDQEEIRILARRGAGVSHNAESNMKLASGVAPIPDLLSSGVTVGLGTDSCAGNNNLDLFSEMDKAAKLHKVFRKDPVVCGASQVLRMATLDGARALGWHDDTGSLEAGKKADLTIIDIERPHLAPLYDPVSHLVYAVKASDVRHVWVDGVQVVSDGRVLTIDVPSAMKEVKRLARKAGGLDGTSIP